MSCDEKAQEIFRAGLKNGYDIGSTYHPDTWKKEPIHRPAWLDEPLTVTKNPSYKHLISCSGNNNIVAGTIEEKKMILNMNNVDDVARVKKACNIPGTGEPTLSHFCWFALFLMARPGEYSEYAAGDLVTKTGALLKMRRFGPVWGYQTKTHLFLEQNTKKDSEPGRRARQGHKIMWIIQNDPNKYIGKVEDGVLEVLSK
jgi:hypothetical protein